ncbi:WG repeat-containing protein [Dysgonomonas sp. 511]|uniref:WG repeat-containing protein n=1 Tax=Dysgonomonas sp. 511 TaxID=2302930 RepID=UPI0013D02FAD|nr:WG repeat-containing protein [Dysgonomonas sp. 511]NDV77933.1 WG repeat-containing protein [Dysgonomonas sp. 511]
MTKLFWGVILLIFVSSCASFKKHTYQPIGSLLDLQGVYVDSAQHIPLSFNLHRYDTIDIFKFDFVDDKYLNLSGLTDKGFQLLKTYKGKYNKDKNYFQGTLSKVYAPFLVVHIMRKDIVRLGKDSLNSLFIDKQYYGFGGILGFFASYDYQASRSVAPISDLPLIPTRINDKWGFADRNKNMVVEAKYEFVRTFINDYARVKQNSKWGLINSRGEEVIAPQYDKINTLFNNDSVYYIYNGNRYGLVTAEGKVLVPPQYDYIHCDYPISSDSYFRVRLNGKMGIYHNGKELMPPIANFISPLKGRKTGKDMVEANTDILPYNLTINKKSYMIDERGQLYQIEFRPNKQGYDLIKQDYKQEFSDGMHRFLK